MTGESGTPPKVMARMGGRPRQKRNHPAIAMRPLARWRMCAASRFASPKRPDIRCAASCAAARRRGDAIAVAAVATMKTAVTELRLLVCALSLNDVDSSTEGRASAERVEIEG